MFIGELSLILMKLSDNRMLMLVSSDGRVRDYCFDHTNHYPRLMCCTILDAWASYPTSDFIALDLLYLPAIPTKRHGNCSRLREGQRHVLCYLACSGRHPSCRKRTTKRKTIREGKTDYVWPDTCNATVNKGWQFAVLTPQSCTNKQISHPSDGFKRLGGSGLQLYLYMDSHVGGSDVLKKWTNTPAAKYRWSVIVNCKPYPSHSWTAPEVQACNDWGWGLEVQSGTIPCHLMEPLPHLKLLQQ